MILCSAYKRYGKFTRIEWTMPKYRENARTIKIPTKEKVRDADRQSKKPSSHKTTNQHGNKLQTSRNPRTQEPEA